MDTKICAKCRESKSLSEFYKDKGKRDGHAGYCKACNKSHCRSFYVANSERLKANAKANAKQNPECRAAYKKDHYARNSKRLIAYSTQYNKEHPEKHRAANKRYRDHAAERRHQVFCTKCGETKTLGYFARAPLGLHGRAAECKVCEAARKKAYRLANWEKVRARERVNQREWAAQNPDKEAAKARRYKERHPDRIAAVGKQYREMNPAKRAFWQMVREARKKQAIPPWANLEAIKEIYANCPQGHHVDHIIPLYAVRGRKHVACGLHCEANLQYLPASENKRKWATMPEDAAAA